MIETPTATSKTLMACQNWLRYADPEKRRDRGNQVSAGIAYLGVVASGGSAERVGSYRPALREAQFYWAAASQPDPMLRAAAFATRTMRERQSVTFYLYQNYRVAWLDWKAQHPVYAYRALLATVAQDMADRLGENIY